MNCRSFLSSSPVSRTFLSLVSGFGHSLGVVFGCTMLSSYMLSGLAALASSASAYAVLPRSESNSIEARQNNGDCIQVSVTFTELRSTQWGESISVVGSTPELGNWNTSQAAFLSASVDYSSSNPLWSGTVNFPPGTSFQYKYILFQTDGTVVWEADPNHSFTVPNNCNSNPAVSNTWQSTAGATPTSAVPATTVSAAPTSTCTNGPNSRSCWSGGLSLDTDFDTKWPNTGRTVHYDWTITNTTMAPDGHSRQVFAINGQYVLSCPLLPRVSVPWPVVIQRSSRRVFGQVTAETCVLSNSK